MRALSLNATLERSPEPSSIGAPLEYIAGRLAAVALAARPIPAPPNS